MRLSRAVLLLAGIAGFAALLYRKLSAGWFVSIDSFQIADNLSYVGTKDIASYWITTSGGSILIISGPSPTVRRIKKSAKHLRLDISDVKILLISHAHFDHCAGSAAIKKLAPGVQYMVMAGDVPVVESGGRSDFQYGWLPFAWFRRTPVGTTLGDGCRVRLGDTEIVAHLTPGHTRGCTTWTMQVQEGGEPLNVVIVGSSGANFGYRLVNNRRYPQIAADFERSFTVLKRLPCDIFLGAHGKFFDLKKKVALMGCHGRKVFSDPEGYRKFVDKSEQAFRSKLQKQEEAV